MPIAASTRRGDGRIDSSTYEIASSRLPGSFDGYCIVQISDLHNQRFGPDQSPLVERVRAARPDMIALTGDLAYRGKWNRKDVDELARRLAAIAPVYFVTGNHDVVLRNLPALLALLTDNGVAVLEGRSVLITRRGESITVAGVTDPRAYHVEREPRARARELWNGHLAALRDGVRTGSFTVLLSHRPELITAYAERGFDLVLSGHAHGGQIILPIVGALYAPGQGWFPRYTSGIYTLGKTRMIVSRGLGESVFPLRIRNRPELVTVRLRKQSG